MRPCLGACKTHVKKKIKSFSYFIYSFSGLQATAEERVNGITAFICHSFIITQHAETMIS